MSRLTNRNVIRILGVCYEDTPFIMMEYMEKGDLIQYLQKFKTLSTTDSEPQGLKLWPDCSHNWVILISPCDFSMLDDTRKSCS